MIIIDERDDEEEFVEFSADEDDDVVYGTIVHQPALVRDLLRWREDEVRSMTA
jgi:hypothetical protein